MSLDDRTADRPIPKPSGLVVVEGFENALRIYWI
jgi:hypothetical protein